MSNHRSESVKGSGNINVRQNCYQTHVRFLGAVALSFQVQHMVSEVSVISSLHIALLGSHAFERAHAEGDAMLTQDMLNFKG